MLRPQAPDRSRLGKRLRLLNRVVLGGLCLFVPFYAYLRFIGPASESLQRLPEMVERLKEPIVWRVPDDGVRYARFYHAHPDTGYKFVLVKVHMEARLKIGFPLVPRCFRLVDDADVRYYPASRSPFFIAYGDSFRLDQGDTLAGDLLFEIPAERRATNLLFDRYVE